MSKFSLVVFLVAVHSICASLATESTASSEKLMNVSPPLPTPTLGSLYRSARDDYASRRHCSNCGPGYERNMRTYGRQTGITGYYSGMGSIDDDRNWYYRPEGSYEERMRGGGYQPSYSGGYRPMSGGYEYDRYMQQRPDDRGYGYGGYPSMMMMRTGYYDGGNSRMPYYPEMMRGYGYRGNGYDNLDPQYEYYMTQRGGGNANGMSSRDRYYGSQGYYDDRMNYGGQYDQKNFRPWDQTYRGISGFDNSGRGYYFASRPSSSSSPSLPPPSSPSSSMSAHASYHVQTQPAPTSGYAGQSGGYEQHQPNRPSAGNYRPEGHHQQQQPQQHYNGPDRPDYESSDSNQNCCRNRYPEQASYGQSNPGSSYPPSSPSGPSGPSVVSYGTGTGGQRPSNYAGSWNYVASGTTNGADGHKQGSGNGHHAGGNGNSHGSYGDNSHGSPSYGGSSHYSGAGSNGPTSHEYGSNRDGDRNRETDHRQQSVAYGGRPRPTALGDTSYLMDRDGDDVNRVLPNPVPERTGANDDDDARAKPNVAPNASDESKENHNTAQHAEAKKQNNDQDA